MTPWPDFKGVCGDCGRQLEKSFPLGHTVTNQAGVWVRCSNCGHANWLQEVRKDVSEETA